MEVQNPKHQSTDGVFSDWDQRFADALEEILQSGTHDLPGIVAALTSQGVQPEDGRAWDQEVFRQTLARLSRK